MRKKAREPLIVQVPTVLSMLSAELRRRPFEDFCEVCGDEFNGSDLVICEGVTCCESCAHEHGMKLAEFKDEMDDDIRNS